MSSFLKWRDVVSCCYGVRDLERHQNLVWRGIEGTDLDSSGLEVHGKELRFALRAEG